MMRQEWMADRPEAWASCRMFLRNWLCLHLIQNQWYVGIILDHVLTPSCHLSSSLQISQVRSIAWELKRVTLMLLQSPHSAKVSSSSINTTMGIKRALRAGTSFWKHSGLCPALWILEHWRHWTYSELWAPGQQRLLRNTLSCSEKQQTTKDHPVLTYKTYLHLSSWLP